MALRMYRNHHTSGKRLCAFAKFGTIEDASIAMKALQGMKIPTKTPNELSPQPLKAEYAKTDMTSFVNDDEDQTLQAPNDMKVALQHFNGDTYFFM